MHRLICLLGLSLQVVSTTKTDLFSVSSTTPVAVTGATVAITPSSTSSKIFVSSSFTCTTSTGSGTYAAAQLLRDSTLIGGGAVTGSRVSAIARTFGGGEEGEQMAHEFLDSPSTTSEVVYSIKVWSDAGTLTIGGPPTDNDNDRARYARTPLTITVMEVAG